MSAENVSMNAFWTIIKDITQILNKIKVLSALNLCLLARLEESPTGDG